MDSFRKYLSECMEGEALLPAITGTEEAVDFFDPAQRDATNFVLSDLTDEATGAPEVMYERVRSVLSGLGYFIPPVSERPDLFGETEGEEVFGMVRPHSTDTPEPSMCFLYFAFCQDDANESYDVLAEVVTTEELEEILYEPDVEPV